MAVAVSRLISRCLSCLVVPRVSYAPVCPSLSVCWRGHDYSLSWLPALPALLLSVGSSPPSVCTPAVHQLIISAVYQPRLFTHSLPGHCSAHVLKLLVFSGKAVPGFLYLITICFPPVPQDHFIPTCLPACSPACLSFPAPPQPALRSPSLLQQSLDIVPTIST